MSDERRPRRWFLFPVRRAKSFWDMNDREQREFARQILIEFRKEVEARRARENTDAPPDEA